MQHLVLICGGQSPEHEISVRSTKNILRVLDRGKYQTDIIGISKSGRWLLLQEAGLPAVVPEDGVDIAVHLGTNDCFLASNKPLGPVDVVLPVLHGPNGEDGAVQGLLQLLGIPYVGSGTLGSAVSMDKDIAKKLLRHGGLKVADWILVRKGDPKPSYETVASRLGEVVFVKPANMGSSVGINRVSNLKEWDAALHEALSYDDKVLVEECLNGQELECAVKGHENLQVSGAGQVRAGGFYSYDEKYAAASTAALDIPAKVKADDLKKLRKTALQAHQVLECKALSRVDMFLTEEGEVFVNEVNTMPGFTSISMYPKLWEQEGVSFPDLIDEWISMAISRG